MTQQDADAAELHEPQVALDLHFPPTDEPTEVVRPGHQLLDLPAAALIFQWSNGQAEGQVNRAKLVKRRMYGRAGFSLLSKRVLRAA